jgi:ABC-type dipeptide/oligopeptide/nickel transport system permease subunit
VADPAFLTAVALTAPLVAPFDPTQPLIGIEDVKKRASPCIHWLGCPADQPQHLMGTDGNVRDLFSRVLYGARLSLVIGLSTVSFAIVVGTALGLLAGYIGGWTDIIIMRFMDVLLAFPGLLLAIAIVTVLAGADQCVDRHWNRLDPGLCTGDPARLSPKRWTSSASRALGVARVAHAQPILPNAPHTAGGAGPYCECHPDAAACRSGRAAPDTGMGPDRSGGKNIFNAPHHFLSGSP